MHSFRIRCWLALVLGASLSAVPSAASCGDDPAKPAAESSKPMTQRLRGKVVWTAEALKRKYGVAVDADVEHAQVALETAEGMLHPIVKDARGRAFHKDERWRDIELELEVRRFTGSPLIQIIRTFSMHDGQPYLLDYWCDICAIPMYELKECECCQGPIRIRERKVDEKTGEVLDQERTAVRRDSATETRRRGERKTNGSERQ